MHPLVTFHQVQEPRTFARAPIRMMSNHGVDTSKHTSPQRPGYQLSRSISEASPPLKHHRHQNRLHQRRHQDRNSDRLPPFAATTLQMPLRGSLDLPRSEGVTPYLLSSAEQSRRASMLPPGAEEVGPLAVAQAVASQEKQQLAERRQAALRTAYVCVCVIRVPICRDWRLTELVASRNP